MESEPIIEVRHIGKEYKVGVDKVYKTLSESVINSIKHPIKAIRQKTHSTDTFWALKDISFDVIKGDVIGIVGNNGAGKSTLLKILSRITYPTTGSVHMRGRVGSLLEVGTGFHYELSGMENIYFNGAVLGMKRKEIDDKFDEIVKFSGVEPFLTTPVKRYSSGMIVRLAFSVAAHLDPEILIIDEVLAVGDAAFQRKCLGKMNEVAESGRTILFVSHNMGAMSGLCKSGIYLDGGTIVKRGDISSVIDTYLSHIEHQTENIITFTDNPNKDICILSVDIQSKNINATKLDVNDDIGISIHYNVHKDMTGANIFIGLDHNGTNVIKVLDTDYNQDLFSYRKKGQYELNIKMPRRFLNIGYWSVSVDSGQSGIGLIDTHHHCLSFIIESNTEDITHSGLSRGGAIIPQFEVETIPYN